MEKISIKYINNEDRKILQEFYDIIRAKNYNDLPDDVEESGFLFYYDLASYIFTYLLNKNKHVLDKYILDDENDDITFLKVIYSQIKNESFSSSGNSSKDLVEDVIFSFRMSLIANGLLSSRIDGNIILLSEEENNALPSVRTIDKFNL